MVPWQIYDGTTEGKELISLYQFLLSVLLILVLIIIWNYTGVMSTPSEDVATKRRRIEDSASPSAVQRKASCSKLPGDVCGHCDKECTPDGEAIQCDLCYVWVHAECEGVTNEQYEKLNSIASTLCNVAYYCQLNSCHTRVKQLIASFISQSVNNLITCQKLWMHLQYNAF